MHVSSVKMANMYDNTLPTCSSYSPAPEPADDISVLLRQILFKSSSSSSYSPAVAGEQVQCEIQRQQPLHLSGVSIPDPIIPIPTLSSPAGANFPANSVARVSSSSVGTIDYEPDEYDCESEDGFENLMEGMVTKRNPTRNPSKRTRAAEVHNLSEKRRRSRINEKMKALQKLIPNSNKTDKASMLNEAIEYLKQLQLQVQMLTMRNGINLYSMCLPSEVVQPNTKVGGFNEGNGPTNMTSNEETLVNSMLSQNQTSMLDFSRTINHEPSLETRHGSFQFPNSSNAL